MDWFRDTLADDKVPDFARFNDELPRTDTGQVRRSDLSLGLARGTIGGKGGCDTHCEWLRRLPRPHPRSIDVEEVGRSRSRTDKICEMN
ncbi:uncharacterized protein METZ01_LOCUS156814 [marine metagenome]|uniref:Uncharacterized protein n=1 Tax=marine metagenome TaxID=408172 RepID=A0A382AQW2_9ZZZZ